MFFCQLFELEEIGDYGKRDYKSRLLVRLHGSKFDSYTREEYSMFETRIEKLMQNIKESAVHIREAAYVTDSMVRTGLFRLCKYSDLDVYDDKFSEDEIFYSVGIKNSLFIILDTVSSYHFFVAFDLLAGELKTYDEVVDSLWWAPSLNELYECDKEFLEINCPWVIADIKINKEELKNDKN